MSILTDGLPKAVMVCGRAHEIWPDYKTALRIITAYEDAALADYERRVLLVSSLYKESPDCLIEAVAQGIRFLDCAEQETSAAAPADGRRYYSFGYDARWIYAGVDRVLRGRLARGEAVHWWEFVTAFMELPEDSMMSRILYMRQQHAKGKLTQEERRQWAQNRRLYELPEKLSATENAEYDEFIRLMGVKQPI